MKRRSVTRIVLIVVVVVGILVIGWIALWLINGGWPASGPAGNVLPPHIRSTSPVDGEEVAASAYKGFCLDFYFRAGNGMGVAPTRRIRSFLDGFNVTKKMDGFLTSDHPISSGVLCVGTDTPLSPGWHTAKVTYSDITKQKFGYTWRFKIIDE